MRNQGEAACLNVATTSHPDESTQEMAQSVLHAARPGVARFRCLLVLDDQFAAGEELMRELEAASSGCAELAG